MLRSILEVIVIWHPRDKAGEGVASALAEHFHGGGYSSLLGGSLEVYMRHAGWRSPEDAPRPILWPQTDPALSRVRPARFVAVVLLVGLQLNRAVGDASGDPWRSYVKEAVDAQSADPGRVKLFACRLPGQSAEGALAELIGTTQYIGEPDPHAALAPEKPDSTRCRDLAQALAQWMSPVPDEQLSVFISHTKRLGTPGEPVATLVGDVRAVFSAGRVATFYDAHDLKSGEDWDARLRQRAATSALLALRTDLYATREWCQREMLTAKLHGMPVVILDALTYGDSRGSFLMDHTPRIPVRGQADGHFDIAAIRRAIDLLADAWLQRVIWLRLREEAQGLPVLRDFWWAPQAPEPSTLAAWLPRPASTPASHAPTPDELALGKPPRMAPRSEGSRVCIIHPDPPLSEDERAVLQQMATMAGYGSLDLTTPRLLATRGA